MDAIEWDAWKQSGVEEVPSPDGAAVEPEIWHYDLDLFAKNSIVDPFSLYLSLKAIQDERIESALQELMEKIKWYKFVDELLCTHRLFYAA